MCCPDQSSYELALSASLLEGNRRAGVCRIGSGVQTQGQGQFRHKRILSLLYVARAAVDNRSEGPGRSIYGGGFLTRSDCHLRAGPGQCELSQQEVLTLSSSSGYLRTRECLSAISVRVSADVR